MEIGEVGVGGTGEQLPQGWAVAMISDVVEPRTGKADPQDRPDGLFIGMEQVEAHSMRLLGTVPFRSMKSAGNVFLPQDVIYGRLRSYLNKVYQPDFAGMCSGEFIVLPESMAIHGRFLKYRLNAGDFVRFASHINTGDRPRVDFDQIKVFSLWLPPLVEQSRIADVLDELFSDLDAGIAALERVREKMRLYRASILKAAVEGALTTEWRTQHPHTEPATELLKRILTDRRRRWEDDQLAKFKAKGQEPPENWKAKYKEPASPDTTNLRPVPEEWCWATVNLAFRIIDYRGRTPPFSLSGIPHLRSSNVKQGHVIWKNLAYVSSETYNRYMTRGLPLEGDILFTTEAPLGEVALVPTDRKFSLAQRMMILRPGSCLLLPRFLLIQLMSVEFQAAITGKGTGTTVTGVSSRNFRDVPLRVPPIAEQEAIVDTVEDQLSVIDHLETDLDAKLKSAQALRQAILRHAFSGHLVPQDTNDEPASELLKRMAAERAERAREAAAAKQETKVSNRPQTGRRGRPKKTAKGND